MEKNTFEIVSDELLCLASVLTANEVSSEKIRNCFTQVFRKEESWV